VRQDVKFQGDLGMSVLDYFFQKKHWNLLSMSYLLLWKKN